MPQFKLNIDGTEVSAEQGATILQVALNAGIYIPALCHHPDLPPAPGKKGDAFIYRGSQRIAGEAGEYKGCQLCLVEVEGKADLVTACNALATPGLRVAVNSTRVQDARRQNLLPILAKHPHACQVCAQREGCAREPCAMKWPVEQRCCPNLGKCELQKVAAYIGIREDTSKYNFRNLPVVKDDPLFQRDYNLCIGCTRCVRACADMRGISALGFTISDGELKVGTKGPSLKESGCKFCGACAEVCPTGAITDSGLHWAEREALVSCKYTCPAGIDVPRYIRLITEGKFAESAAVIRERVPLPTVLGHVCIRPCETECRRAKVSDAMAICGLKRSAADNDNGLWKKKRTLKATTGKKVAVVGAGPAGLTASYYLSSLGHKVTLIEASDRLGGMTFWGIPEYRLARDVVKRDVDGILNANIDIKLNTAVGKDIPMNDLKNNYDAIFLATGSHKSRSLPIKGVDLKGVYQGVYFLRDSAGHKLSPTLFKGKKVVVIGGGGVAIDCARTSLRLGAREVELFCLESKKEMPAKQWDVHAAAEEGVKVNYSWGPMEIVGDTNGQVKGIAFKCCTAVFDAQRKFSPQYDECNTCSRDADAVVVAIGQAPDLGFLEGSGVNYRNTVQVDKEMRTSVGKVFAGGDAVAGAAAVIDAIAAARAAAVSIDKYLGGSGDISETLVETGKPSQWLGREEDFSARTVALMGRIPVDKSLNNFSEVELGFSRDVAVKEAKRCLQCDLRLLISKVTLPPKKEDWLAFNEDCVSAVPEKEGVYQLLDEEKTVIFIAGAMNLRQDLQEHLNSAEGVMAKARFFVYHEDPMFTMKESELIQAYMKQYGKMPEGNEDLF